MALSPTVTSSIIMRGLYESEGLFNKCNRSYDSLVSSVFANSVDIPKNPQLVAKGAATAKSHADRKGSKTDIGTVNVPFEKGTVPVYEEYESWAETNGVALKSFSSDVVIALEEYYDKRIMAVAQASAVAAAGDNIFETGASVMQSGDLDKITKFFALKKINKKRGGLYCFVDANIVENFLAIDMIRTARAFNKDLLEKGIATLDWVTYVITANLAQVSGKYTLSAAWLPGIAFILKKGIKREQEYDTTDQNKYIDWISYFGVKVPKTEFSCVMKLK